MEAVEWAGDRHQLAALGFEGLPDRAVGQLGMLVRLGVGDASVEQPGIQLVVATRSRGVKKRSRTKPTWFSTWPFSQPDAGVQAVGSTR